MERIRYFDFLRGIAIFMVVAIHCFSQCFDVASIDLVAITARNLMNMAVPVFFGISGFFLVCKRMTDGGYSSFLRRQIPRVYIPVLFCSIPYLIQDVSSSISILPVLKLMFCGYSVYYFVAVVIQCYLLLPLLQKKMSFGVFSLLFLSGLVWNLGYTYYVCIWRHAGWPLIIHAGFFPMWGVFFYIGMLYREKEFRISYKGMWIGAIFFGVLSVLESLLFLEINPSLVGLGQKASAYCMNVFVLGILFHEKTISSASQLEKNLFYRAICIMGDYAFGIYLIHRYFLALVCRAFSFDNLLLKWMIAALLVTLICMAILATCKKYFPKMTRLLLGA